MSCHHYQSAYDAMPKEGCLKLFSRSEQVIIVRLGTAHTRLNAHMLWRAVCLCCKEDQTKEHILQNCKMRDNERTAA